MVILGGNNLRAAGRAAVDSVGQVSHLGVTALAGVMTDSVEQGGYAVERLQERPTEDASAIFAAGRVVAEGSELVRFAERAGHGV
jgi:hypothetical protein